MSTTIAISGKGGSGKTTVAAMIVRYLVERAAGSILAVDADPNACLGIALGLPTEITVADIRDATLEKKLPGQADNRERAFEYAVQRAVAGGALATTHVGAREGMPTAAELEEFLAARPVG